MSLFHESECGSGWHAAADGVSLYRQIKSNQIYLPAQNVKEKQLKKHKVNTKNQRHTDYEC